MNRSSGTIVARCAVTRKNGRSDWQYKKPMSRPSSPRKLYVGGSDCCAWSSSSRQYGPVHATYRGTPIMTRSVPRSRISSYVSSLLYGTQPGTNFPVRVSIRRALETSRYTSSSSGSIRSGPYVFWPSRGRRARMFLWSGLLQRNSSSRIIGVPFGMQSSSSPSLKGTASRM